MTNIVYFEIRKEHLTAETPVKHLDRNGVKVLSTGERRIRAVTHYHIRPSDIETVTKVFNTVISGAGEP